MKKIVIKNGSLLSPIDGLYQEVKDIYLENGFIKQIAENITVEDAEIIDASNCLVTPGLIDIHAHCYPDARIGLEPDVLGIQRGATTILDAGSSGADNYEAFKRDFIDPAKTRVYTLLNVSKVGLSTLRELDDLSRIDKNLIADMLNKYGDNIVGLKARASASVVGENGLTPIAMAADLAREFNLPLTIHVGNYPPALTDVLNLMGKNDICTHAFHGKKGGIIEDGKIIEAAIAARNRGVKFDIGHGVASFSFRVFEKALEQGFNTDFISTDLHIQNYEGPVYNLAAVLTKMLNIGLTLEDCITKVTSDPATHYGLKNIGQLKEGYFADISILKLEDTDKDVVDSIGDVLHCTKELKLATTIVSRGEDSEVYRHVLA